VRLIVCCLLSVPLNSVHKYVPPPSYILTLQLHKLYISIDNRHHFMCNDMEMSNRLGTEKTTSRCVV
jgi:hypothetical protein